MEKKKALLVVAGGRAVPDILALFWVKPQVVCVVTSEQGWSYEDTFIRIAQSMACEIDKGKSQIVDAYDFDACLQACRNACESYSDTEWDWIFTISSSPKVMAIAAYEAAKEKGVPCWHVDTQREHVVSLIKPVEVDREEFFHLTLGDYMRIQHRRWRLGGSTNYRDSVKKWAGIARELAISNSSEATELLSILYDKYKDPEKAKDYRAGLEFDIPSRLAMFFTLRLLEDEGLLKVRRDLARDTMCSFTSEDAAKFIGTGDWLEFFVWQAAINSGIADEQHCQWGCDIKAGQVYNEFDLMLMYKAQLIVAECKAEREPFRGKKDYLGDLNTKADMLGGPYVSKIFITNQPAMGDSSYQSFSERAKQYKIVVVTAENLHEIGQVLKREAENPTYPRI